VTPANQNSVLKFGGTGKQSKKHTPEERLRAVQAAKALPEQTEEAYKRLAADFDTSGRTLYRWVRRFEDAGGPQGLADSRRGDAGRPRIFRFPGAVAFVLLKYLEGWTVPAIHKNLKHAWPFLYSGFRPPSRGMVRSLIRSISKARKPAERSSKKVRP
jgi:hypothetical protein